MISTATTQPQTLDIDDEFNQPPKLIYPILEVSRAVSELLALFYARRFLDKLPRGDGQPVMALPGFGGSDSSTKYLRKYIGKWGYDAHPWDMGRNLYPTDTSGLEGVFEVMDNVTEKVGKRLAEIKNETGRKTSLVGWSLGGIYCRQIAAAYPDLVRQVVTLGTPYGDPRANILWPLIRKVNTSPEPSTQDIKEWIARANVSIEVPLSAIWSNSDGFVPPRIARQKECPITENIHVCSSHTGFTVNPLVYYVLANRLAQPEGDWQPFNKDGWRGLIFDKKH
jgi:pimeloyl-ACP methyl ester carboxylesterase